MPEPEPAKIARWRRRDARSRVAPGRPAAGRPMRIAGSGTARRCGAAAAGAAMRAGAAVLGRPVLARTVPALAAGRRGLGDVPQGAVRSSRGVRGLAGGEPGVQRRVVLGRQDGERGEHRQVLVEAGRTHAALRREPRGLLLGHLPGGPRRVPQHEQVPVGAAGVQAGRFGRLAQAALHRPRADPPRWRGTPSGGAARSWRRGRSAGRRAASGSCPAAGPGRTGGRRPRRAPWPTPRTRPRAAAAWPRPRSPGRARPRRRRSRPRRRAARRTGRPARRAHRPRLRPGARSPAAGPVRRQAPGRSRLRRQRGLRPGPVRVQLAELDDGPVVQAPRRRAPRRA